MSLIVNSAMPAVSEGSHGYVDDCTSYIWILLSEFFSNPADILSHLCVIFIGSIRSLSVLSAFVTRNLTVPAPAPPTPYTTNTEAAFEVLQRWYNDSTGLYDTTGWWNGANCLTVIGNLAAFDPNVRSQVISVLANSFVAAPNANPSSMRLRRPKPLIGSHDIPVPAGTQIYAASSENRFLNEYYDDEGWYCLAWIQAYDITQNVDYLQTAEEIFADMKNGTTTNCGSGIWWDKAQTYVNSISNELYLSVASHLANRAGNQSYYLEIAQQQLDWFQNSGLINSDNLINDGLDENCHNNNGTIWTYNQGVILGGLVELNKASPKPAYMTLALKIATSAIKALGANGVLRDICEPDCGPDATQFKGIFMRNLQHLQKAAPNQIFLDFITSNAAMIWAADRNDRNELSVGWAGPFANPANASTHSSAMDALVAAAAFASAGNGTPPSFQNQHIDTS